ncbi:hypothetical protein NQ315_009765 [Exocentrus adspersus]|uniref:Protein misato n=1 Tax=Exocentrus adspersus TaxID=1586481 RepID=A0AAV8WHC3_9CUCU|nr:hypothetical protein NQ315_009765 [Exocentrus adspersus]
MNSKGILTLQFGHYSNFIGTHWWNIQEQGFDYTSHSEIDHDVLYREGVTNKHGVTFTPRLLLVDLKGSLKHLPERGELYDEPPKPTKSDVNWDSDLVEIEGVSGNNKNQFLKDLENPEESHKVLTKTYDLEKDVTVWSDFLYSRFHPRTVTVINEYQHENEHTPFDAFPLGKDLWNSSSFEDDFSNKIRSYVEECDYFQGFHLLSDCTDAFSGLSAGCMEHLEDDYCRKSILAFPVVPSFFPDSKFETKEQQCHAIINESVRVLNLALSFNAFNAHSSLFVPLCMGSKGWRQPGPKNEFNHTVYDSELAYHSSAILAAALDTFTLKHRLKSSSFSLVDLCADLSHNGRKAAAASLCMPFSFNVDANLLECLDNWEGPLTKSITPNCTIGSDRLMQYVILRGIREDRLKQQADRAEKQRNLPAYKCDSITEMLSLYLSYSTHATINNVTVVRKPLDVKTPFPRIFDEFIGQAGYVGATPRPGHINVESVPVMAGLHSGSGVGDMLESLYTEARRIKYPRFHQFINAGIDKDEYEACLESLLTLRENYMDNYYI